MKKTALSHEVRMEDKRLEMLELLVKLGEAGDVEWDEPEDGLFVATSEAFEAEIFLRVDEVFDSRPVQVSMDLMGAHDTFDATENTMRKAVARLLSQAARYEEKKVEDNLDDVIKESRKWLATRTNKKARASRRKEATRGRAK